MLALQVPGVPRSNCERLCASCNNRMLTDVHNLENYQASYHPSPVLIPADLIDFEPTLAELNLSADWDALYMDTLMQDNAYDDAR